MVRTNLIHVIMAAKIGTFTSINDRAYKVEMSGPSVKAGTLLLAADPVSVAMEAGERKFVGFKTTTCRVSVVTDEQLTDLYASGPRDILLTVTDVTAATPVVVFKGNILPFSFDQPCGGVNDIVEVHAVDLLSAQKSVKYTPIEGSADDREATDIILEICRRVGITKVSTQDNFGRSFVDSGTLEQIIVAQAGFVQDGVTLPEVVSSIAIFVGYTANVVGDTLYLYDEHFGHAVTDQSASSSVTYTYTKGAWSRQRGEDFAPSIILGRGSEVSVNVERAYDGVQITPSGSDFAPILPNVLDEDNLTDLDYDDGVAGDPVRRYNAFGGEGLRIPRTSSLMETGSPGNPSPIPFKGDSGVDYMDEIWYTGAIPMLYAFIPKQPDGPEQGSPTTLTETNMMWVKVQKGGPTPGYFLRTRPHKATSHTGGYFRVDIEGRMSRPETDPANVYVPEGAKIEKNATAMLDWLHIRSGNMYLNATDSGYTWASARQDSPLKLSTQGGSVSRDALQYIVDGCVFRDPGTVNSGELSVEGILSPNHQLLMYDFFLTRLSITGVGDTIDPECADMRVEFKEDPVDMLSVDTLLTTRNSGRESVVTDGHLTFGVNARGLVITTDIWEGYLGRQGQEAIPIAGVLMEQLTARYKAPHVAYHMTVDDHDVFTPAPVLYRGDVYTVDSYERNLRDDLITLTID